MFMSSLLVVIELSLSFQVGEADDTVVASGGGVEEEDQPQQAMPTRDATRMQDTDLTISQPDGNGKVTKWDILMD